MNELNIKLGERLRELRQELGLTQKECAAKFGLNNVTYLHYEKSQREPPLSLLVEFSAFYGVSVDYLLGLNDIG